MELDWPHNIKHLSTIDKRNGCDAWWDYDDDYIKQQTKDLRNETQKEFDRLGLGKVPSNNQMRKMLESWLKKHLDDTDEIPWNDHQWFLWLMNQDDLKNFLTIFNNQIKISYNINCNLKQGEFIKMTDDKFIKKQPDKVELMTTNAKKFMGLTISINDPKNKEFFWINQLDPSFEYFGIGSMASPFTQTTKKGKKIKKYFWELDNLPYPLYAPSWMALKSENENNVPYWVVAIKNDDYNKDLIKKLIEISGDSVQHITKENKDNFKVLY